MIPPPYSFSFTVIFAEDLEYVEVLYCTYLRAKLFEGEDTQGMKIKKSVQEYCVDDDISTHLYLLQKIFFRCPVRQREDGENLLKKLRQPMDPQFGARGPWTNL
jgi:hypothetical protein